MTSLSEYQVLIKPHVTEKTSQVSGDARQYVFKVASISTKAMIKAAVEKLFEVKVDAVNILKVRGKSVRVGKTQGCKKSWKKAYVTLQKGQEIDAATVK